MELNMRNKRIGTLLCALVVIFSSASAASRATGFGVSPVEIDFEPGAHSASLDISSADAATKVMQVTVYSWNQAGGKDVEEPTTDVIASPVIFTLGPLATQTIRLALTHRLQADTESSYRIMVTEVPSGLKMRTPSAEVSMAFSIPVFVAPSAASNQHLQWQVASGSANSLALTIHNPTNVHAKIEGLTIRSQGNALYSMGGGHAYVLAGQSITLQLKTTHAVAGAADITAKINGVVGHFSAASGG
jgi:fimbrial chaperone protein